MTTATTPAVHALVRIGWGEKRHPALVTRHDTAPGEPWNQARYTIDNIVCSCPDTSNGHARHRATIIRVGDDAWAHRTCGPTEGDTT